MKLTRLLAGCMLLAACGDTGGTPVAPAGEARRDFDFVAGARTFTATITGPSSVKPGVQCAWYASTSGGAGGNTYSWEQTRGTGFPDSGDPSRYIASSTGSFIISVTVFDVFNNSAYAQKSVTVSSSAPNC